MHEYTKPYVAFHFLKDDFSLGNRTKLKKFVLGLFKKEKVNLVSLDYIFCNDDYLLAINQNYLKHDYFTDIIGFDLSDKNDRVVGEIYISIDRVKDNATLFESSFKQELHRVIFHGALHLCGFGDKTLRQSRTMRRMEEHYLSLYF